MTDEAVKTLTFETDVLWCENCGEFTPNPVRKSGVFDSESIFDYIDDDDPRTPAEIYDALRKATADNPNRSDAVFCSVSGCGWWSWWEKGAVHPDDSYFYPAGSTAYQCNNCTEVHSTYEEAEECCKTWREMTQLEEERRALLAKTQKRCESCGQLIPN